MIVFARSDQRLISQLTETSLPEYHVVLDRDCASDVTWKFPAANGGT